MVNLKKDPKTIPASLDADDIGAKLVMLAEVHTMLTCKLEAGEYTPNEVFTQAYLLGNIEGRLQYDHCFMSDLELIDDWERELEGWKGAGGVDAHIRKMEACAAGHTPNSVGNLPCDNGVLCGRCMV